MTQVGATAFVNGLNTLTQGVDATINYPTDFGDMGLIDWTLAGNYNSTSVSSVAPNPPVFGGSGVQLFPPNTLFNFVHSAPQEKVALTANWTLDEYGITFRETYWGPQKNLTSPDRFPALLSRWASGGGPDRSGSSGTTSPSSSSSPSAATISSTSTRIWCRSRRMRSVRAPASRRTGA